MKEAEPLDWYFYETSKGSTGIVKFKDSNGKIKYYISAVDGLMPKMDVLQVIAWGVEFPENVGKLLFKVPK
jgi:hypothetical protein